MPKCKKKNYYRDNVSDRKSNDLYHRLRPKPAESPLNIKICLDFLALLTITLGPFQHEVDELRSQAVIAWLVSDETLDAFACEKKHLSTLTNVKKYLEDLLDKNLISAGKIEMVLKAIFKILTMIVCQCNSVTFARYQLNLALLEKLNDYELDNDYSKDLANEIEINCE